MAKDSAGGGIQNIPSHLTPRRVSKRSTLTGAVEGALSIYYIH